MSSGTEKFFFNLHDFGEDAEELLEEEQLEEDLPPPPPTFSEEELEAAKQQAFADGQKQAREEAQASQLQAIQTALQKLAIDTNKLFSAEEERNERFEAEAVHLSQHIFEVLFPLYMKEYGHAELMHVIKAALDTQDTKSKIEILVHPSDHDLIQENAQDIDFHDEIIITSSESVTEGSCDIQWTDGGAQFDFNGIREQVAQLLQQALVGKPINRHDDEDIADSSAANYDIIQENTNELPIENGQDKTSTEEDSTPDNQDDGDLP